MAELVTLGRTRRSGRGARRRSPCVRPRELHAADQCQPIHHSCGATPTSGRAGAATKVRSACGRLGRRWFGVLQRRRSSPQRGGPPCGVLASTTTKPSRGSVQHLVRVPDTRQLPSASWTAASGWAQERRSLRARRRALRRGWSRCRSGHQRRPEPGSPARPSSGRARTTARHRTPRRRRTALAARSRCRPAPRDRQPADLELGIQQSPEVLGYPKAESAATDVLVVGVLGQHVTDDLPQAPRARGPAPEALGATRAEFASASSYLSEWIELSSVYATTPATRLWTTNAN